MLKNWCANKLCGAVHTTFSKKTGASGALMQNFIQVSISAHLSRETVSARTVKAGTNLFLAIYCKCK
jgi:hypothetical protein